MVEKIRIKQIDKNRAEQFARDLYKECYFIIDSVEENRCAYIITNTPNFDDEEIKYITARLKFLMKNNISHNYNRYNFNITPYMMNGMQNITICGEPNFNSAIYVDYKEKSYSKNFSSFI